MMFGDIPQKTFVYVPLSGDLFGSTDGAWTYYMYHYFENVFVSSYDLDHS